MTNRDRIAEDVTSLREAFARSPEDICRELVVALRSAVAPWAGLTDAEVEALPHLMAHEVRFIISTRRAIREYTG